MGASHAIARRTVQQYFDSFNQGQFDQTAALFAETGQLIAPFEGATTGPSNIQKYLEAKAKNMVATPEHWDIQLTEDAHWRVDVIGKVKTRVFQVNINWLFDVASGGQLTRTRVKLIASPAELLSLRTTVKA